MKEFNNEMNSFIVNHRQVSRSWYKHFTDREGKKRTTYNIVANKFHFNAGAQRQEQRQAPQQTNLGVTPQDSYPFGGTDVDISDDALPF